MLFLFEQSFTERYRSTEMGFETYVKTELVDKRYDSFIASIINSKRIIFHCLVKMVGKRPAKLTNLL
jgi:hypothetical protein